MLSPRLLQRPPQLGLPLCVLPANCRVLPPLLIQQHVCLLLLLLEKLLLL